MDCKIVVKLMPYDKCLENLKENKIDGLIGLPVSNDENNYLVCSMPISDIDYSIFYEKNTYAPSLKSLEGTIVGILRKSPITSQIREHKNIRIIEVDSVPLGLEKLEKREISALIAIRDVANYYIRQEGLQNTILAGPSVGPIYEYSMCVNKKNEPLLLSINSGIASLVKSGKLSELRHKWFGLTSFGPMPWKKLSTIVGVSFGVILLLFIVLWMTSLNIAIKRKSDQLEILSKKIIEKDKLAVLGKLAGQIAHELRTPLSIMSNTIYLIRREDYNDKEKINKRLNSLEDKIKLTGNILESILSYSRVKAEQSSFISVKKCIDEVIKDMEVPSNIQIHTFYKTKANLMAFIDFHQLYSVLRNLFLNAVQAMNTEGTLSISVFLSDNKKTINIKICDTAKGIPEKDKEKIFSLFYSSKITGTGLGLPISKSIIEANDGDLSLEKTDKHGSCFLIKLPFRLGGQQ